MKNILSEYIDKFQKHHKDYRRYIVILILLAFATFVVVNWQLHQTGISMTADYQCGYKEHTHTDACYTKVLICGKEETDGSEGHTHTDDCYEEKKELTCSKEEHTHEASCYDEDGNLICGKEEHTHTDDCYTTKKVLICGKKESPKVEAHHHTDKCYEKKLTCKLPEHTHTVECLSNEKADVETASDWEKTLPSNLSDDTAANVVAVAKSQIGYKESTKNFKLADDGKTKKGYTRYGDWYGDKYGDWSAMFASFVYHYAGVSKKTVPVNSGAYAWTVDLKKSGLYKTTSDYSPAAGDLVFFDTDKDGKADQVGVVEKVTDTKITVVEGDYKDEVAENSYKVSDGTITGYCSLPTKEEKKVTTLRSKKQARAVANEINLNDYVTSGTFEKKQGSMWIESSEFNTNDQVRATINFEELDKELLQAKGNTAKLQLPEGFDCSKFANQTFKTYDDKTESGTYKFEKGSDGLWYIVLTLNDSYVEKAGEHIGGSLQLQFQWNKTSASEEGKKETIKIGNWTSEVIIKKDKDEKPAETGNHFSLFKSSTSLSYSNDGKTGYIEYTITLDVKTAINGPLDLTDTLTGNNWTYDKILSSTINANWTVNDNKAMITVGKTGETIQPGTYTITYRIKNDKISELTSDDSSSVGNVVSAKDGEQNVNSNKWTNTTVSTINKQGKLVDGEDTTYIDYTVYLNAGDIIKDLKNGTTFTDTLPNELELVGNVTVGQYDVNGKLVKSDTATVNGQNISYKTPTGQYYYIITYRTKLKDSVKVPIGGMTIKNDGHSSGDINGGSSSTIPIPNHVLSKKFKEQNISKDDNDNWTNTIKWESEINIKDSLKGYVYEDWSSTKDMTMSDAQRQAIKLLDKDGNEITSGYTITTSNKENGLFKIEFTNDVTGPVTIQYETTADLTNYTPGQSWLSFTNYASIADKDGHMDNAQASSNSVLYEHDFKDAIYKYGASSDGNVVLKPGETTIPWTILVNRAGSMTDDLDITDKIASNLTFVKDSLKITLAYWKDVTNKVDWTYDETSRTLKVHIPKEMYVTNNESSRIEIFYRTELPESFYTGSSTTEKFSNTASVEQNGSKTDSSFEQNVTRQVIGKSGKYDKKDQTLTYEIIVNPDASKLNDGKPLTIVDTLDAKTIKGNVKLKGLTAFTALKTKDSNGNTKVEPGTLVKTLTQSDSGQEFTYKWDESNEVFTTYLPDNTAYVLVAEYYIPIELSEDVTLSNEVKILGEGTWSAKDESTKAEQDTSGHTYTNKDSIAIVKHDSAQYNNLLNGAEFKLEEYDNGNWVEAKSTDSIKVSTKLTTGGDNDTGKAYTAVQRNVLYRLTETKAPDKYIMDSTPHYFIVVTEGTTPSLPESIKDNVKIYTVPSGKKDFANIVIDRYNAYDKTTVEEGQLRVIKEWVGADGKTITDPTELAKMKDVKVTLTKRVAKKGHTVTLKASWNSEYQLTNLFDGCYLVVNTWNDLKQLTCSDSKVNITWTQEDTSKAPTYKIGPITSDCTILSDGAYNSQNNFTSEGGTPPTGYDDTTISTETLNPATDWSHLWTKLETGDGISYILTEETVDGYKTTYTIDGKALTAGDAFTLGKDGSKLTVTNTADEEYVLPETGGIGTLPFTVGGILLITLALICGYALKRKR